MNQTEGFQLAEGVVHGGGGGLDDLGGFGGGEDGLDLEGFVKAEDGGSLVLKAGAVCLEEIEEAAGAGDGFLGCFNDSGEEKTEPVFPFALKTDFLEELVVFFPVLLEMEGEVEEWLAENAFRRSGRMVSFGWPVGSSSLCRAGY